MRATIRVFLMSLVAFGSFSKSAQGIEEAIDCQDHRPNFSSKEIQECCREPPPNYKVLPKECYKFTVSNRPASPCAIECILNGTKSLENGKLKFGNLRPIVTQLYGGVFVETYLQGFANCVPIVNKHFDKLKASRRSVLTRTYKGQNCSTISLMYSVCAQTQVFINCPKSAWIPSSSCEYAKKYAESCELYGKDH